MHVTTDYVNLSLQNPWYFLFCVILCIFGRIFNEDSNYVNPGGLVRKFLKAMLVALNKLNNSFKNFLMSTLQRCHNYHWRVWHQKMFSLRQVEVSWWMFLWTFFRYLKSTLGNITLINNFRTQTAEESKKERTVRNSPFYSDSKMADVMTSSLHLY